MRDFVWPDVKSIAEGVVRQCVRAEMGKAGMCLGNSLIERLYYGYSVKVKYLAQVPVEKARSPGLLGSGGSASTSEATSATEWGESEGVDEWKKYLV